MSRKKRHKKNPGVETETVENATPEAKAIQGKVDDEDEKVSDTSSDPPEKESSGLEAVGPDPDEGADESDRLALEAREMRLLAQRKQAEFENYRKRVERERVETFKYAAFDVVREILPVLDNLERALAAATAAPTEAESQLREGVEIIGKQFGDTLAKLGLAEVEAKGAAFDPHIHEAVTRVETDEHPEGTVVDVLQKGYLFKDRLLRPSMVSVAQPPGGESSNEKENHESEDEAVRHGD